MKKVFIILFLLVFPVFIFNCAYAFSFQRSDIQKMIHRKTLRVAIPDTDNPPFFFVDKATGTLKGIDIDTINDIASELGVKVKYIKAKTYNAAVDEVARRKADIAYCGLSATLIRAKKIYFSNPYEKLRYTLLYNKTKIKHRRLSQVMFNDPKITIGVEAGTSFIPIVKKMFPKAVIKEVPIEKLLISELAQDKITAMFSDEVVTRQFLQILQAQKIRKKLDIIFLKGDSDLFAIGVSFNHPTLLQWLNLYLLKKDIADKYARLTKA